MKYRPTVFIILQLFVLSAIAAGPDRCLSPSSGMRVVDSGQGSIEFREMLLKYANIDQQGFVERFEKIIEEETGEKPGEEVRREFARFRKKIPAVLRIHSGYKRNCGRASFGLFSQLLPDFSIAMREKYIKEPGYDMMFMEHAFCVLTLGSVPFILDATIEQFDLLQDESGKNLSLGVVLMPARIVFEMPERFGFYVLGPNENGRINHYPVLFKEGVIVESRGYHVDFRQGVPVAILDKNLVAEKRDFILEASNDIDPRVGSLALEMQAAQRPREPAPSKSETGILRKSS
jgi:hypothetical protein